MPGSDFNLELFRQNESVYAALGFALSNFAQVEFGLLAIFDRLSELEQDVSSVQFWSLGSTRKQLKEINRIATEKLAPHLLTQWKNLKQEIEACVAERDSLAHGEVVALSKFPGHGETFFSPRFQINLPRSKGQTIEDWEPLEKYDEDQLIELAKKFWLMGRKLSNFWDQLPSVSGTTC